MNKSLRIELNADYLLGKVMRAAVRGEPVKLRVEENDKEGNPSRPDFKSFDGVSVWVNEG